jgi:hypothetical protein
MFARTVSLQLKPNSVVEFTKTIENDIIPLLRPQPAWLSTDAREGLAGLSGLMPTRRDSQ